MTFDVGRQELDIVHARRGSIGARLFEELIDAVKAEDMAPGPGSLCELDGGIAPAAADIDDAGAFLNVQVLQRHTAVIAQAVHQDVAEAIELVRQRVVPEYDVLGRFGELNIGGLLHGESSSP